MAREAKSLSTWGVVSWIFLAVLIVPRWRVLAEKQYWDTSADQEKNGYHSIRHLQQRVCGSSGTNGAYPPLAEKKPDTHPNDNPVRIGSTLLYIYRQYEDRTTNNVYTMYSSEPRSATYAKIILISRRKGDTILYLKRITLLQSECVDTQWLPTVPYEIETFSTADSGVVFHSQPKDLSQAELYLVALNADLSRNTLSRAFVQQHSKTLNAESERFYLLRKIIMLDVTYKMWSRSAAASRTGNQVSVVSRLNHSQRTIQYMETLTLTESGRITATWSAAVPSSPAHIKIIINNENGNSYVARLVNESDSIAFYEDVVKSNLAQSSSLTRSPRRLVTEVTKIIGQQKYLLADEYNGGPDARFNFWVKPNDIVETAEPIIEAFTEDVQGKRSTYVKKLTILDNGYTRVAFSSDPPSVKIVADYEGCKGCPSLLSVSENRIKFYKRAIVAMNSADKFLRDAVSNAISIEGANRYLRNQHSASHNVMQKRSLNPAASKSHPNGVVTKRQRRQMQYPKVTFTSNTDVLVDGSIDSSGSVSVSNGSGGNIKPTVTVREFSHLVTFRSGDAGGRVTARSTASPTAYSVATKAPKKPKTTTTTKAPKKPKTTTTTKAPKKPKTTTTTKAPKKSKTTTTTNAPTSTTAGATTITGDVSMIFPDLVSIPPVRLWVAPEEYLDPVRSQPEYAAMNKFKALLRLTEPQRVKLLVVLLPEIEHVPSSERKSVVEDTVTMNITQREEWCGTMQTAEEGRVSTADCVQKCIDTAQDATVLFVQAKQSEDSFCKFGSGLRAGFLGYLAFIITITLTSLT